MNLIDCFMDDFTDENKQKERNDRESFSLLEVRRLIVLCVLPWKKTKTKKHTSCFCQSLFINKTHFACEIGLREVVEAYEGERGLAQIWKESVSGFSAYQS